MRKVAKLGQKLILFTPIYVIFALLFGLGYPVLEEAFEWDFDISVITVIRISMYALMAQFLLGVLMMLIGSVCSESFSPTVGFSSNRDRDESSGPSKYRGGPDYSVSSYVTPTTYDGGPCN